MKRNVFLWIASLLLISSCGIIDKGEKLIFGLGEVYYKDGVSAKEAEALGNYLYKNDIFTIEGKKVIQLLRVKDTLTMRVVTNENYIKDSAYIQNMRLLTAEISSAVFNDQPINTDLITPYFNTESHIKAFGRKILTREGNYYYSYSIGEEAAAEIFIYLNDSLEFFTNFEGSLLVNDLSNQFEVEICATDQILGSPATSYTYKMVALSIGKRYLKELKKPIILRTFNLKHELYKTYIFENGTWK